MRKLVPDVRLLVCMLLGVLVYLPTLRGEFVWDDLLFVGRWVGSTDTFWEIFFPPPGVIGTRYYYRPITQGFATLLWAIFGENAPFWHAAIILVHVLTIGLVYYLLREWWLSSERETSKSHREWAAIVGAGFYAVWPANAESIAWISSRADTLLGPFLVGAIVLHLRARDRGGRPVGAAFLFFCCLLVKETGIVFLPMAAAATLFLARGASASPAEGATKPYRPWASALWLPHVLVYFVYSLMRKISMGSGVGLSEVALKMVQGMDVGRIFRAWGFYVQEALSLGAAPPFLREPPSTGSVALYSVLGIIATAICAILLVRKRTRSIGLTAVWFTLPLGPPLATVSMPLSQNSVTVHYLYIPNIALAAAVSLFVCWALARTPIFRFAKPALCVAMGLALWCGIIAHARYQPWMSGRALWTRAIHDNPYSCIAQQNLGISEWTSGDEETGLRHLRIAAYVCQPPQSAERHGALISLSQLYTTRGQWAAARTALREAQALEGSLFMLGRSLEIEAALLMFEKLGSGQTLGGEDASVVLQRNELRRAISVLEDATRIDRFGTESRITLAVLYSAVGERPRALQTYEDVLRVTSSENIRSLASRMIERVQKEMDEEQDPMRRAYERGQLADLAGRLDEAQAGYEEALELTPGRADILLALADVLARNGELPEATARAEEAAAAEPESPIAWLNLGVYRASRGDIVGAEAAFGKARSLEPGWAKACLNHGLALRHIGRPAEAATVYENCLSQVSTTDLDARHDLTRELRATQIVPLPASDENGPRSP